MIKVQNIHKSYADVKALKDISFNVSKGELFGFIGPDGAGKTTLLRILTTLLLADEGSAKVNGYDLVKDYLKIRKIVGYMPGKFSLYQDLTVLENLEFFATVFGTTIDENYDLIKDIYSQIEPFKHRRAGKLSGGMKQKLALSCALIHKPKILILDEPTTGVDAVSRKEFWDILKNIQKKDISILVSTPYMDEASLCDRVALIQKGEFLSINTPENIIKSFDKNLLAVRANNMYQLLLDLRNFEHTDSVFLFGQYLHLTMKNNLSDKELLNNYLISKKYSKIEIVDIKPNIEDCFMDLMGKN
ncbi:MAG: ABC transporter ATP-binding protein [Bacteroidetes bacterium]|nr:MAG: ABC transporter ATP-binding protein [Bacteroidota bacterium]